MADVVPQRINIQSEEVAYKSAVSEATLTRVGASQNFINYYQHDSKQFSFNGRYYGKGAPQLNIDGAFPILFDCELTGVCLYNMVAGSAGSLQVDVRRYTATNTGGTTIFTTKPAIAYTVGNNSYVFSRFGTSAATLENPAGTTEAVLSVTNLNAGDMLVVDITAVQTGGENGGLVLFHRPR